MKTKRRTEIIVETHEITKVYLGRGQTKVTFDKAAQSPVEEDQTQDYFQSAENHSGFKARVRERLRAFWKRSRRPR